MKNFNFMLDLDSYKLHHVHMYPKNTTLVYSNFTPRKSRVDGVDYMVFFGLQYLLKEYLIKQANETFFSKPKDEVISEYKSTIYEMTHNTNFDVSHIAKLHDLGYLPLKIKALPEGSKCPIGVPALTMYNTRPDFFWITNYLETLISNILWKPCTSSTSASVFRYNFDKYAEATGASKEFVDYQGHDFSFRGMSGLEDACLSGSGHLLFFKGTDTVPALQFLREYYNAKYDTIGTSVPASEHSISSAGGQENELETLNRLLNIYPEGVLSFVSDTWDLFKLVSEYLPKLKDKILARNGTLVIRPDSGTPHKILNGDPDSDCELEKKGVVRLLDEIFGSTTNSKGFRVLNSHIGTIYGDSIDFAEQLRILEGLRSNGYVSTTTVMGMGSFTYQYVTRDTFGTVCKATYCEIDGQPRSIFKNPKTGGWKKSHKGLLRVNDDLSVEEEVDWTREGGVLRTVFEDGELLIDDSLDKIRERI